MPQPAPAHRRPSQPCSRRASDAPPKSVTTGAAAENAPGRPSKPAPSAPRQGALLDARQGVLLHARQRATSDARQRARDASDARKKKDAAIRELVRKQMEQEASEVRARAEAAVAAKAPPMSAASAQAVRAGKAMQALAGFRAEEGLAPAEGAPHARREAREFRLSTADQTKLDLIRSLEEEKRRADAELREISARRAARAEDRAMGRQPRPATRPPVPSPATGESGGDHLSAAVEDSPSREGEPVSDPRPDQRLAGCTMFQWSVGGQPLAMPQDGVKTTTPSDNRGMTPQQLAAWKWANRDVAQPGPIAEDCLDDVEAHTSFQ